MPEYRVRNVLVRLSAADDRAIGGEDRGVLVPAIVAADCGCTCSCTCTSTQQNCCCSCTCTCSCTGSTCDAVDRIRPEELEQLRAQVRTTHDQVIAAELQLAELHQ